MPYARFGLRDNPFRLTPDLTVRCDWAAFAQARRRLATALREGRKAALSGEPGVGKTLLLRSLAQEMAPAAAYVVCTPRFELADLERALGGAQPSILLLDDAQNLTAAAFEALLARADAMAMAGPASFGPPALECIPLAPLSADEVAPYVLGRLAAAGCRRSDLFEAGAFERLYHFSQGAPRRVNNLCSAALFLAAQRRLDSVPADLIDEAAAGLSLQAPPPAAAPRRRPSQAAAPAQGASPIIVAAFMRGRAAASPPPAEPSPPEQPQEKPPAAAEPPVEAPAAPEPPRAAAPEPEPPAPPQPTPIRRLRPVEKLTERPWPDPEPPEPQSAPLEEESTAPRRRRRRWAGVVAFVVAAAAFGGAALALRLELLPRPTLPLDWDAIEAVMSPQDASAKAPRAGSAQIVVRPAPADAFPGTNETQPAPIVFPNAASEPQSEALAAAPPAPVQEASAPSEPPAETDNAGSNSPAAAAPAESAQPSPSLPPAASEPSAPSEPASAPTAVAAAPAPPPPPAPPAAPETAAPEASASPAEPGKEERIAALLAQARRQTLSFALTTPPGQSAFDSYREVLELEPQRPEAIAGLDEIAARYDDLAALARQRDKPALVQLYETRAAHVRRERARLAGGPQTDQSAGD